MEQVEQWIGAEVVDRDGAGIGKVAEVYFRGTDAVLVAVKGGRLKRKHFLIPLDGATASRNHLRVAFAGDHLVETKNNPDNLDSADLAAVSELYGSAHQATTDELESSTARQERLKAAAAAEQRAQDLESQAASQAQAADEAAAKAEQAKREAQIAADAQRSTAAEAEAARADARKL